MSVNVNAPFGLRHLGVSQGGAVSTYGPAYRKVAYNYGTPLYQGDVMVDLGNGYIGRYTSGIGGSNVVGVVNGFEYLSSSLGRKRVSNYLPTGDTAYDVECSLIPILGVPPQLFVAQATSTPFTVADIGQTLEPAVSASGTIIGGYGKSGMTFTQSGNEGTTNTYPFRIIGLWSDYGLSGTVGTDNTSNYNWIVVMSNPYDAAGV